LWALWVGATALLGSAHCRHVETIDFWVRIATGCFRSDDDDAPPPSIVQAQIFTGSLNGLPANCRMKLSEGT
jgi:hypothetical protein